MVALKKYLFPIVVGISCSCLFLFHIWMAWPGYIHVDTPHSLLLTKDNWHPIIIVYLLQFFYWLFGVHVYYMLLFNLVPFYLGLFIFVLAFYQKFRTKWALLFLFPAFIGNIFFQNFVLHSSSLSPMWIFLLYAIVFYAVLNPIQGRIKQILFYGVTGIIFVLTLLSRHNAIVQVFPIAILWVVQLSLRYSFSKKKVFGVFLIATLVTLSVSVFIPRQLQSRKSYPAQHILLHQMAGACVPADDSSCFKEEWYQVGSDWEKVKSEYQNNLFFADRFSTLQGQYRVFRGDKLEGLPKMWMWAILKHPYFYLQHVMRFVKQMWLKPVDIENIDLVQRNWFYDESDWLDGRFGVSFPKEERHIQFTPEKTIIYKWLRQHLPFISNFAAIGLVWFCAVFSFILLLKKRKEILLWYIFLISGCGGVGYILFAMFSPTDYYRYMHPGLASAIASVIGLLIYGSSKTHFKRKIKISPLCWGMVLLGLAIIGHAVYANLFQPIGRIYIETTGDQRFFDVYAIKNRKAWVQDEAKLKWWPWWMEDGKVYGRVFESDQKEAHLDIHVYQVCELTIKLLGSDVVDSKGRRLNPKVTYSSFKIDGQEILSQPQTVWHDNQFEHKLKVAPGLVKLDIYWHRPID